MIFTSAKALQYISIPTYTVFKNLTIIFIAYGEVLWFGSIRNWHGVVDIWIDGSLVYCVCLGRYRQRIILDRMTGIDGLAC